MQFGIADRYAFAAFSPARIEHFPTGSSAHAFSETVLVPLFPIGRLECPFHGTVDFFFSQKDCKCKAFVN